MNTVLAIFIIILLMVIALALFIINKKPKLKIILEGKYYIVYLVLTHKEDFACWPYIEHEEYIELFKI